MFCACDVKPPGPFDVGIPFLFYVESRIVIFTRLGDRPVQRKDDSVAIGETCRRNGLDEQLHIVSVNPAEVVAAAEKGGI